MGSGDSVEGSFYGYLLPNVVEGIKSGISLRLLCESSYTPKSKAGSDTRLGHTDRPGQKEAHNAALFCFDPFSFGGFCFL